MTIKESDIVCKRKQMNIQGDSIAVMFGDVSKQRERVMDFLHGGQEVKKIRKSDLEKYNTAFFEKIGLNNSPSDVMCDFVVDRKNGKVIAKKLFNDCRMGYLLETREYLLSNYGKTWRCWTGYFKTQQQWL